MLKLVEHEHFEVQGYCKDRIIIYRSLLDDPTSNPFKAGPATLVLTKSLKGELRCPRRCGNKFMIDFYPSDNYIEFFEEKQSSGQVLADIIQRADDYLKVIEGGRVTISQDLFKDLRRYVQKLKQEIIGECNAQK